MKKKDKKIDPRISAHFSKIGKKGWEVKKKKLLSLAEKKDE